MKSLDIAKEFGVRLNLVYQILYDLEGKGIIEPDRAKTRINWKPEEVEIMRNELQRRGYKRKGE
jgi:sugar-specific transcriptional regulator TrmB